MINLEQARNNMLKHQCRAEGVLDEQVLGVMRRVPREDFVPAAYRSLAFADCNIPLGYGQVMLRPKEEGLLLQALQLKQDDKVLEVGTGSGYFTALLATMAAEVHSVDRIAEFVEQAKQKLAKRGISNAYLHVGDAANGWDNQAPYTAVAITGSLPVLPQRFRQSITVGGRIVAILGKEPVMRAYLITRTGEETWVEKAMFETWLPPLLTSQQPEPFQF